MKGCERLSDYLDEMLALYEQGYDCAQILMRMVLDAEGKENPDMIRALAGLNGGIGGSAGTCGCMTGGACLLAYYAGKGADDETAHKNYQDMMLKFTEWFKEYTTEYGGVECYQILDGDNRNKIQRCPLIMEATLEKCLTLLEENELL